MRLMGGSLRFISSPYICMGMLCCGLGAALAYWFVSFAVLSLERPLQHFAAHNHVHIYLKMLSGKQIVKLFFLSVSIGALAAWLSTWKETKSLL